jgi:terminase small subunit / prophage DNA-packing protein
MPDGAQVRGSKREMAEWLGVSERALDKHEAVLVRVDGKYDVKASVIAYCAHLRGIASGRGGEAQVLDLTKERARLAKEQADEKELKNAVLRGDLLPAAEVEATWSDFLRGLRSRMLALPSRAQVTAGLTQAQTLAVDKELRLALAEAGGDADD